MIVFDMTSGAVAALTFLLEIAPWISMAALVLVLLELLLSFLWKMRQRKVVKNEETANHR